MKITTEPREDFTILHLRGEFDTFYCAMLQKEVDQLIAAGEHRVALNMRLIRFINSTALGAILRASKVLGKHDGKLVVARPSIFSRKIMETIGMDRVVPIYDTDEQAGAALREDLPVAVAAGGEIDDHLDDDTAMLFSPRDHERIEHFIAEDQRAPANPVHGHAFGSCWRGVGRMSSLDFEGLGFLWTGGTTGMTPFEMGQMLSIGTELEVKFRLPLFKKGYCQALVQVGEVEERADSVKIAASFSSIDPETQEAVKQYASDIRYLKDQLRQATEEAGDLAR